MQINQSITNTQCRDNVLKGLFGEYLKTEYVFYILRSYDLKSNEYDVDILCNKYHVDYLLEITNAYFYRLGFVSIYSNNYGFHLKRVYIHNENHSVFLIDFQGGLEKGGVRFLGGQYFLENSINVRKDSTNYLLEPCLELVSLVYHCVFDKKFFDDKHLKAVANLRKLVTYDDVIRVVLIDFNNSTAQSIVNKIFNDKEISNLCLNRNILLRESSSYLDLLNYFYRQTRHLLYRLNKFSNPHGFLVCFIGVDGSGKTLYSKMLSDIFSEYPRFYRYHLNKKDSIDLPSPSHGSMDKFKAIRSFFKKSRLVLKVYMFLDQYIKFIKKGMYGYLRGDVIVFDRYIYDSVVLDIRNYKLSSFDKFLLWLIPKPNVVFLLYANNDNIIKRKKDNTNDEVNRQQELFAQIATQMNFVKIDTDNGIENSFKVIKNCIFKEMDRISNNTT